MLGADDGIISTASLVLGVAAAHDAHANIVMTATAGLVAGAMSMAAGEYVSVHSQSDTEQAALAQEKTEIDADFAAEQRELTAIYRRRGLDPALAHEVAAQLMKHDPLGAHARDELGLSTATAAQPLQAALASAASFAIGASWPLAIVVLSPESALIGAVAIGALAALAGLGALAAKVGGADAVRGTARVAFWGALSMGATAAVGALFGTVAA